jgi:hypothetical protein
MPSFWPVSPDWHAWHRAYDDGASALSLRLGIVQRCIADALDAAPAGPVTAISMCAGEGRDLLGVLAVHPRAPDVHARLVELDPQLASAAREQAPARVEVLVADAGISDAYEDAVPASLVLVCGVFGNVTDDDIARTVSHLPMLCAPGARVVWTRHRRPPDITPFVRQRFAAAGFAEVAFHALTDSFSTVGVHAFAGEPQPFRPHVRFFDFVGYDSLQAR